MALSLPKTVVVDTGFWFALFERTDQNHRQALTKAQIISSLRLVLPWPCLYETLNTRFLSNRMMVRGFERFVKSQNVVFADDSKYREGAYNQTLRGAERRPIALVDMVIRSILEDVNTRTNCLLTFNQRDFVDVCRARQIEIL